MTGLEKILFWVGALSTFVAAVRVIWVFCLSNVEWINDVSITELSEENPTEAGPFKDSIFPQYHATDITCYTQTFLIRPNDVLIKSMKLIKYTYSEDNKKRSEETVKVFKNVSPYNPLIIKTEIPELLPSYALAWYGDYGAKATYVFHANGRDNNYNRQSGFKYEFGFIQKVRKVIGLK